MTRVAALIAVVLLALTGCGGGNGGTAATPPPTPAGPASYAAAGQIIAALGKPGLVQVAECKGEKPVGLAISQQRCGSGKELIVMVFPSGQAADERVADLAAMDRTAGLSGALVRGPNWVVNVGDFDPAKREAVRAALSGTMVSTG